MADLSVRPVLHYRGEGGNSLPPIEDQYVVVMYQSQGGDLLIRLVKTDSRGIMYPCASDVGYTQKNGTGTVSLTPNSIKFIVPEDSVPVSFRIKQGGRVEGQRISVFMWPYRMRFTESEPQTTTLDELINQRLLVEGTVNRKNKEIPLDCPLDVYLTRLRNLTERVQKKVDHHQQYVNRAMTCGGILDQVHTLLTAKGRGQERNNEINAGRESDKYKRRAVPLPEVSIVKNEVIGYLREDLDRKLKYQTKALKRTTKEDRRELKDILNSTGYDWQLAHADWEHSSYSEREAEKINARAIEVMADACPEDAKAFLDDAGFTDLLKESAKGKKQAQSVAKKIEKNVQWLWKMKSKIMKLASTKRKLEVTAALNIHAERGDFIGAARYLEARGVMKNVDDLGKELEKATEGNRLLGAESLSGEGKDQIDKYINASFPGIDDEAIGNLKGGIGSGLAMLELASALQKDKKGIRDDVGDMKAGLNLGTDLAGLPMIEKRLPELAKLSKSVAKYAGPAGDVFDWGCSVQDLYKAADEGSSEDFAYSVVSYGGKGLVAGGAILMLTPLAPLGGVLVGIGTAIDTLGSVTQGVQQGVINYASVEEKQYRNLMEKQLKKYSPDRGKANNLKDLEYDVRMMKKVGETDTFKNLTSKASSKQAKALNEEFANQTLKTFTSNFLSPGFTTSGINWTLYQNA